MPLTPQQLLMAHRADIKQIQNNINIQIFLVSYNATRPNPIKKVILVKVLVFSVEKLGFNIAFLNLIRENTIWTIKGSLFLQAKV